MGVKGPQKWYWKCLCSGPVVFLRQICRIMKKQPKIDFLWNETGFNDRAVYRVTPVRKITHGSIPHPCALVSAQNTSDIPHSRRELYSSMGPFLPKVKKLHFLSHEECHRTEWFGIQTAKCCHFVKWANTFRSVPLLCLCHFYRENELRASDEVFWNPNSVVLTHFVPRKAHCASDTIVVEGYSLRRRFSRNISGI